MNKLIDGIAVLVLLGLAVPLMLASWRRRRHRQAGFDALAPVPAETPRPIASGTGLYLATTPAGQRLERIAVAGLGFRARGRFEARADGLLLALPERPVFIPAADIERVDTASWAIDRGIEPGGITVIGWRLGGTPVESFLRLDEPGPLVAAIRGLAPAAAQTPAPAPALAPVATGDPETQNGGDPQ
ncbi:MAG: hypothetical protein QM635_09890 [Microbacteriaceae bacterium]